MTAFNLRVPLTRLLTAAECDANISALAVDARDYYIVTAANQSYTIAVSMPHGGTINTTTTQCISGTCTATFKVNAVSLSASNAVSSSVQAQAQASGNTFLAGDQLLVTISANASALGVAISIKYSRNLD